MTMSLFARWLSKLVPERHKQAACRAEVEAVDSRLVMRDVAARHHKVEDLTQRMVADLVENHFADRVACAMRGHS